MTPTAKGKWQNGCVSLTGPTAFSAPPATGSRTRSFSPRTICGGSRGTAYASRATSPTAEGPHGCGDRREDPERGGKNPAGPATSRGKARDWGRVFPLGDIRQMSWHPGRFRTGSQGSAPMEGRPARVWSLARRATMFMEAGACRWGEASGNSCDEPWKKAPTIPEMRGSALNATRERRGSTDLRIASPATPPTRTRRAKRRAGSAIPSQEGRCSIATGRRGGSAVPATKSTETVRKSRESKSHAMGVILPPGRSGRLPTLCRGGTPAWPVILSTGSSPRPTSVPGSERRYSRPISLACGATEKGEKDRCLEG